ncbi:mitochondrial carrier [Fomitopsis serialis]|uniref:mitochondrial carrier n=1 Tax=Fomitopsis serialis TaxID=139415 RepID=UPI002008774B|nr:mitochondrial carrier [Neoantrodia serialis]KAH9935480.1 mitochondrial carrier [Neoantrodia serialis]
MGFVDFAVLTGIITASLGISLLITVPLTGALVRLRANYSPRGLQLDAEGNIEPHTGPVVTSFFGMLRRVKRLEGWAGLYKGLMPSLLFSLVLTVFAVTVLNANSASRTGRVDPPAGGILGTLMYSLLSMLVSLPAAIITYRSVTTPYKLPYFRPLYSLRILLTPTERKRPWVLYLTPGLLTAEVLHVAYTALLLSSLRSLLLPHPSSDFSTFKFGIYLAVEVLSTFILCPIEVITTKLAIQRNHAAPEFNSVEQEVEGDGLEGEEYTEYAGAEEDVIGLRHEKDPYLGFADCAKRIIEEEGWTALYRAWWITLLGGAGNALATAAPAMA